MKELIDWIGAEADRVEEAGMVRRRGRFTHEGIGDLPAHVFPGGGSELTTEGEEGVKIPPCRTNRDQGGALSGVELGG